VRRRGTSQGVNSAETDREEYAKRMNHEREMGTCHGVGSERRERRGMRTC